MVEATVVADRYAAAKVKKIKDQGWDITVPVIQGAAAVDGAVEVYAEKDGVKLKLRYWFERYTRRVFLKAEGVFNVAMPRQNLERQIPSAFKKMIRRHVLRHIDKLPR